MDKKMMEKMNNREYRAMQIEVRSKEEDNENYIVEGYATTFNEPYSLYRGSSYEVIEQVDAHAFDKCDMKDVIFQYDHNGRVFARNKNGTLKLEVDSKGLKVTADLGGTQEGRNLYEEIKGGYTDKMSFGFVVEEDKTEYVDDKSTGFTTVNRTITSISKLYDVSAVSIPANDMTSISARNFSNGVIAEIEAERLTRAKEMMKLKLRFLEKE